MLRKWIVISQKTIMNLRHFYFIQYVKQNILIHIKKLIFFSKCDCAHLILSSVFISFLLIIAGYKVHIERQLLLVAHGKYEQTRPGPATAQPPAGKSRAAPGGDEETSSSQEAAAQRTVVTREPVCETQWGGGHRGVHQPPVLVLQQRPGTAPAQTHSL